MSILGWVFVQYGGGVGEDRFEVFLKRNEPVGLGDWTGYDKPAKPTDERIRFYSKHIRFFMVGSTTSTFSSLYLFRVAVYDLSFSDDGAGNRVRV